MDKNPALPAHETRSEYEYIYHWHRIVPAAAAIAIGVGAVLWLWPSALQDTESAGGAPAIVEAPVKTGDSMVVSLPSPVAENAAGAIVAGSQGSSSTGTAGQGRSEDGKPADTKVSGPTATAAVTTPASAASNALALKEINSAPPPSAGVRAGQVKISDRQAVRQAGLHQVLDQDPLDLKRGAIQLSKKKAVKVVFSGSVAEPETQINYLWYLDGKLKAKVATRSTAEATTTGSKYISFDAPGNWQVQMVNADGKVLAEAAFAAKR